MNNRSFHVTAIILAAGTGSRMKADISKQRMIICGESVLRHTLHAFSDSEYIDDIVLVCRPEEECTIKLELANDFPKVKAMVCGGKTRAESALRGFLSISEECQFVAIHDAARCLVTSEMISSVVKTAFKTGAATAASRVCSTLKRTDSLGFITDTVSRENMYFAETPQVFSKELYARAIENKNLDDAITDDNMLVESIGVKIKCVDTGGTNIKITTQDDLLFAEYIINRRKTNE